MFFHIKGTYGPRIIGFLLNELILWPWGHIVAKEEALLGSLVVVQPKDIELILFIEETIWSQGHKVYKGHFGHPMVIGW